MSDTITPPFQTHQEYLDYVDMVAHNALEQDSSPRIAAESVVVDTENVGEETTINISATPYVDNPYMQERLWPKDVIGGAMGEMPDGPTDLRSLAVEVLTRDVYQQMFNIENGLSQNPVQNNRWEHRHDDGDAPL